MQMGLWYLRRARFEKAEPYLQTAVRVLKRRNPHPYDGEPEFYLGVVNKFLGKIQAAYDCFWKSTWNKAWADAGYFEAACISMMDERWEDALDELERALISNSHNHKARAMKAVVLRKLGRKEEALAWIQDSYKIDPFNYVCMVEEHLLTDSQEPLDRMIELMHGNIYNYHETALDYAQAGQEDEVKLVLQTAIDRGVEESPLTYYYMGFYGSTFGFNIKAMNTILEHPSGFAAARHPRNIGSRGCNIALFPQQVLGKSLRNCNFEGINIPPFMDFNGVDIRGCRFSEDDDPKTFDGYNTSFKNAIYDSSTTYNGVPFDQIYGKCMQERGNTK